MTTGDICGHGVRFTSGALCQDCLSDENATEIEHLVGQAREHITTAIGNAGATARFITDLTSNRVYDIELAEGSGGADAMLELGEAIRHLRNVSRIIDARARLLEPSVEAWTAEQVTKALAASKMHADSNQIIDSDYMAADMLARLRGEK